MGIVAYIGITITAIFALLVIIATIQVIRQNKREIQRFALAIGLPERMGSVLGSKNPGSIIDTFSSKDIKQLPEYIGTRWGIDINDPHYAQNRILLRLKQFWSDGSITNFRRYTAISQSYQVEDAIAYDAACFVELITQALALKLIAEEQAWGLLFINAQRVQDCYDSWAHFSQCYLRGRHMHYAIINKTDMHAPNEKIQQALTSSSSEFNQLGWKKQQVFSDFTVLTK